MTPLGSPSEAYKQGLADARAESVSPTKIMKVYDDGRHDILAILMKSLQEDGESYQNVWQFACDVGIKFDPPLTCPECGVPPGTKCDCRAEKEDT